MAKLSELEKRDEIVPAFSMREGTQFPSYAYCQFLNNRCTICNFPLLANVTRRCRGAAGDQRVQPDGNYETPSLIHPDAIDPLTLLNRNREAAGQAQADTSIKEAVIVDDETGHVGVGVVNPRIFVDSAAGLIAFPRPRRLGATWVDGHLGAVEI